MRSYTNLIFYLIQLVCIQSDGHDSNHFYEKLLQSSSSTSVTKNVRQSIASQANTNRFDPSTKGKYLTTRYFLDSDSVDRILRFQQVLQCEQSHGKMCYAGSRYSCCSRSQVCRPSGDCTKESPLAFILFCIPVMIIGVLCSAACECLKNDQSTISTTNSRNNSEPSPFRVQQHLELTRQRIENFNTETERMANLRMTTVLEDTIDSTDVNQLSPPPPSYDDFVQRNLFVDRIEPPPPTYDNVMRENP